MKEGTVSRDAVMDKTGEVCAFVGSGRRAQQSRTNSLLEHLGVATTKGGVQIYLYPYRYKGSYKK